MYSFRYKEPSSSKVMIRLDSSTEEPKEEAASREEPIKPPMALHTVLLQNNLLTQIPEVGINCNLVVPINSYSYSI